jgi:sugar/nucleoside kinase (ribokinase family)
MKNKEDIVVVGSVAFDDIQTNKGSEKRLLGGSGTYFSIAASLFTKVHLVGVVGDDFEESHIELFNAKSISTKYLSKEKGETFHWGGIYSEDFSTRDTLFTKLGVFENFNPKVSTNDFDNPILFLANIQPNLQMQMINQVTNANLVVLDTMNLWIENNYNDLIQVIEKTDILLINDEEILQLTNKENINDAARDLLKYGLKYVIVKKGSEGSLLVSQSSVATIPAVPGIDVFDPTGAGDSFAGGFLGSLASTVNKFNIEINESDDIIINSIIVGTAIASFTVSNFGINGIKNLQLHNIEKRIKLITDLMKGL